jgi:hypothetical protein
MPLEKVLEERDRLLIVNAALVEAVEAILKWQPGRGLPIELRKQLQAALALAEQEGG